MNSSYYTIITLFLLLLVSTIYSNSRVAFSRPNSIYSTPGSYFPDRGEGKISLGFSTELIDFEVPSNSTSTFINTKVKKWNLGFSYTLLPDYRSLAEIAETVSENETQESPYEIGLHLQRRIYGYNHSILMLGYKIYLLKIIILMPAFLMMPLYF